MTVVVVSAALLLAMLVPLLVLGLASGPSGPAAAIPIVVIVVLTIGCVPLLRWHLRHPTRGLLLGEELRSRLGPWPPVIGILGAVAVLALSRLLLDAIAGPADLLVVFALQLAGATALWTWNERLLRQAGTATS